jgi:hypothetical protein
MFTDISLQALCSIWEQNSLLYLDPSDPIYPVWLVAVEGFSRGIAKALNLNDKLNNDWVIEQLEEIPI